MTSSLLSRRYLWLLTAIILLADILLSSHHIETVLRKWGIPVRQCGCAGHVHSIECIYLNSCETLTIHKRQSKIYIFCFNFINMISDAKWECRSQICFILLSLGVFHSELNWIWMEFREIIEFWTGVLFSWNINRDSGPRGSSHLQTGTLWHVSNNQGPQFKSTHTMLDTYN